MAKLNSHFNNYLIDKAKEWSLVKKTARTTRFVSQVPFFNNKCGYYIVI